MPAHSADALWTAAQRDFNAGDQASARLQASAVLAVQPWHSGANLMLSNIATRLGLHREATERALAAARQPGPQSLQHLAGLGLKLITLGEYEAACRLALKIRPEAVPAPSSLAEFSQQLSLLEQHDDALRYLEAALRLGLDGDWVHYVHGNYLKFVGRIPDAAAAYERSLGCNPLYALSHHAIAYLGHGDPAARVDRVRAAITASEGRRDIAYLHYALFKELDALGDTAGAWAALEAGFRDKRTRVDHDAREETAVFDALIAATPPGFIPPAATGDGPTPLFVLGMPRTGTTLLERILGGHSQVALCGELNDFRMQFKWCSDYFCLGFLDRESVGRLGGVDYAQLGQRYLEHVAWRLPPGASHFTDKNPGNFMLAGLILKALPQARIIHLQREPMDSCFSNLKELFGSNAHPYSYDFADLATHYGNYSRLMQHWHALAPGRILDVQYEALVSNPEANARRLCDYCGLDYRPEQIRIEGNAAPVSTASSAQVRQPIHARNVGGWKRYAGPLEPLRRLLEAGAD